MLRRITRLGSDLLPNPSCVLAASDPWSVATTSDSAKNSFEQNMASLLLKKDAPAAYYVFNQSRRPLPARTLSRLLAIIPSGAESAHLWWPKAYKIAQQLGTRAQPADFAVLINLASKAGKMSAVDYLWDQLVYRDTNVWNQYIQATCDADPRFWPWPRTRTTSFASTESAQRKATNDVFSLLELMDAEGVSRNSRTFELVLLAVGRNGSIESCEKIVQRLWIGENRQYTPEGSTFLAVAESFAFNGLTARGYALCKQMGELPVATSTFWTRMLRLTVRDMDLFNEVWQDLTSIGRPSVGAYWIRAEFLDSKCRFNEMFALVPLLPTQQLVQSVLGRATVGLANTNRALEALKQLRTLSSMGIEPEADLLGFLAERGATVEQLQLFEEDDDEDTIY